MMNSAYTATASDPVDPIYRGLVCAYCGKPTQYVDSAVVYGTSYGMIYRCASCDAYVGVHKGTATALGRVANKELSAAKVRAHYYFNQLYTTNRIHTIWPARIPHTTARSKAYLWLSRQMKIDPAYCHIGMFDCDQCNRVVALCAPYVS